MTEAMAGLAGEPLDSLCAAVACPTLVIHGEDDQLCLPGGARRWPNAPAVTSS